MDKNFIDKFSFIFGTIQTFLVILGFVLGLMYVAHLSYTLGEMEDRLRVLELQNPIQVNKGINHVERG